MEIEMETRWREREGGVLKVAEERGGAEDYGLFA